MPRSGAVAAVLALALVAGTACGGGDEERGAGTDPAPAAEGRLPFDLGPGIVRGGGDVVPADGVEVPTGRFVDAVEERPDRSRATVYRWIASDEREADIQAAVTELVGDPDVRISVDGPFFEFETGEAHGHGGETSPTTVAATAPRPAPDEADARRRTAEFLGAAGFDVDPGDLETFEADGFLSVEASVSVETEVPVLRTSASLTFDHDGHVVGGYGPAGEAVEHRTVGIVDLTTALRRLELAEALAGHPTTSVPATGTVSIVAADLALSLREVVTPGGVPSGESLLVPVYRLVAADGTEHEVNAVVAEELRIG